MGAMPGHTTMASERTIAAERVLEVAVDFERLQAIVSG